MKEQIVDTLLKKPDRSLRRLVHDIAEQRGIRPLATQGHIGDIVPGRLVYDVQTMGGRVAVRCSTLQVWSTL